MFFWVRGWVVVEWVVAWANDDEGFRRRSVGGVSTLCELPSEKSKNNWLYKMILSLLTRCLPLGASEAWVGALEE